MKQLRVDDEVWAQIRKVKFVDGMKDYNEVLRVMLGMGADVKTPKKVVIPHVESVVVAERVAAPKAVTPKVNPYILPSRP